MDIKREDQTADTSNNEKITTETAKGLRGRLLTGTDSMLPSHHNEDFLSMVYQICIFWKCLFLKLYILVIVCIKPFTK
ncbi:hypothetical protein XELAEV_18016998mg [Xenopus laevis]|uniref:Uncharacterized protein n=1 Tax=Xenopus laevis TaxID=8355 RepID=A0A974HRZ4_XENLA|nr:hypothetical protein XELAEV_18016998mg [Xenopus laevis]